MYGSQGKYEDSIKECTKALDLNPVYKKVLLRRAEAHEKLEHFEEAVAGRVEILFKHLLFLVMVDTLCRDAGSFA